MRLAAGVFAVCFLLPVCGRCEEPVNCGAVKDLPVGTRPNNPLSATAKIACTRTMPDGNVGTEFYQVEVARDHRGRVVQKRFIVPGDPTANEAPVLDRISVEDPQKHERTRCTVATRVCETTNPNRSFRDVAGRPSGTMGHLLHMTASAEDGGKVVSGFRVTEYQETYVPVSPTAPAGFVTTLRYGYSQELGVSLELDRKDSEGGREVVRYTKLEQQEPDSKEFALPRDYKKHRVHAPIRDGVQVSDSTEMLGSRPFSVRPDDISNRSGVSH